MAFRETSPSFVNRMNQLSIDQNNKRSGSPFIKKPRAPALKAIYRQERLAPENSLSSPERRDDEDVSSSPTIRHAYLTPQFLNGIDSDETKKHDGRPSRTSLSPKERPQGQLDGFAVLGLSPRTSIRNDTNYIESLIPSFLLGGDGEGEGSGDGSPPRQVGDRIPSNPWAVPNPSEHTGNVAAPPPHLRRLNGKSPPLELTLERLGPLRRKSGQRHLMETTQATDYIPEPPRIPFVTVARKGLPKLEDLPELPLLPEEQIKEVPFYENLIRSAVSEKVSGPKNPELAEKHLHAMIIDFYSGVSKESPNGCCYNMVLHAYASIGDATKTEQVLKLMWEDFGRGNKSALPNTRCYTSLMYAWQKSRNKYHAPEACENILADMYKLHDSGECTVCKPDLFAFTCILHCWADSKRDDAIVRAQALFDQMLDRYIGGETDLLPDNVCYSNLINVYILTDPFAYTAIKQAESKFWDMVNLFFKGHHKAAPTARNFNTILAAFSKLNHPSAAPDASAMIRKWERLYEQGMLPAKPDAYTFSLMLKCWAASAHPNAVEKLLGAVNHLKNLVGYEGAARFDRIKYVTVIGALAKHNEAQKAHDMLLEMSSAYESSGRKDAKPDLYVFRAVMSAWCRHTHDRALAATRVEHLVGRLWTLPKMDPDLSMYNVLLKCCKYAQQAWKAHNILREMKELATEKKLVKPDQAAYQTVIDAWKFSSDASKCANIRSLNKEFKRRFGVSPA